MRVVVLGEAAAEIRALPVGERSAIAAALSKLEAKGPSLGYPHSSAVMSAKGDLRELRPRAGRCAWRLLYRRIGGTLAVAAVGPDAAADRRGFDRSVHAAERRLAEWGDQYGRDESA